MGIVILALLCLQLSFSQPLLAQEARKIAIVSLSKIFDTYEKTKDVDEKLEKEGKKKSQERDKLVEKINKLRDEIQLLSREAREKKENELSDMMRGLQDFDREASVELRRERDDMVKEIFTEMNEVIIDYGKKHGYDIIFDDRVLLYASDSIDITNDVIKILNKSR
ncbi:OmpH family outer membrane protein [Omnitrophica bacterium]|nr:OmpH family outer membrane protein [Candidatus Omnitrophota bacterium]